LINKKKHTHKNDEYCGHLVFKVFYKNDAKSGIIAFFRYRQPSQRDYSIFLDTAKQYIGEEDRVCDIEFCEGRVQEKKTLLLSTYPCHRVKSAYRKHSSGYTEWLCKRTLQTVSGPFFKNVQSLAQFLYISFNM
jgi:hypothetical protein